MIRPEASLRIARVSAALGLVLSCVLLGAAIGLLATGLFTPEQTMDWDRVADARGGLTAGGAMGLVAGGYLASGLSVRARWWSAAAALLMAAGTLWSLALTGN